MSRKVFNDSVTELPPPQDRGLVHNGLLLSATDSEHKDEKMTILFSFGPSSEVQTQLEARVAEGEVLSPAERVKTYGSNAKDRDALIAWLKKEGFEIVEESNDGASVYARG